MKRLFFLIEKTVLHHRSLVIILIFAFLIRLPSLFEPLWVDDEAIYLTIGQKILRGGLLYVDIFDHKTPGIYYLSAATIKFLGANVWSFRFLLMVWALATLVAFYLLAKKMFGQKIATWSTIFLAFLTSTPILGGNAVNSEILMLLPIILGVLVGLDKNFFLSGIFFSLGFLLKFPAIFDFAAFFIFAGLAFRDNKIGPTLKNLSVLVVGFLLPILLVSLFFAARGAFATYLAAIFSFNISYLSSNNHFIIENGLLIVKALPLLIILIYLTNRFFFGLKSGGKFGIGFFEFLIIWLVFSFYAATLAGRPYEHYLIQAAPAFSLLAAVALWKKVLRKLGILILTGAVVLTFFLRFQPSIPLSYYPNFFLYVSNKISFETYANSFKPWTARDYSLASFLKGCQKYNEKSSCVETRTKPEDKLYIFSSAPAIYFLSGLDPASRYVNFWHVVDNKETTQALIDELANTRPRYILVEESRNWQFPELENLLSSRYNRLDYISTIVSLPRYNLFAFYEDLAIYKINEDSRL